MAILPLGATAPASGAPAPIPFQFGNYPVRVVMRDGAPWFVAADVCTALGYANPRDAVAKHLDHDERSTVANSYGQAGNGAQQFTIINESGLYALVLRSRKPQARRFAKWVTGEVLPSIRKTGGYGPATAPASLAGKRWELVFDHRGGASLRPLPQTDLAEQVIQALQDPGALYPTVQLHSLINVATARLAARAAGRALAGKKKGAA
ncbi:MAG: Bro-N domain-containing protein [Comamonadaceae bacterium]|nr:Bro-N domain-containing protein [Comamonadaceae bacterium]